MLFVLPTLGVWYVTLLTILFVIVSLFMMLVILIQKPRGGGLSGAFGGAGGSAQSVFGGRTGDVLTGFTVVCFVLFIGLAMVLTWTAKPEQTVQINSAVSPDSGAGAVPDDGGGEPGDGDGGQ